MPYNFIDCFASHKGFEKSFPQHGFEKSLYDHYITNIF